MADQDNLNNILERLLNGNETENDIEKLKRSLLADNLQIASQLGKYNVNIGEGKEIHIGDRHYHGADAETIEKILRTLWEEIQSSQSKPVFWKYRHTFRGHRDSINAVAITSDSKTLISVSDDKTIKVWSLNPPKLLSTLAKQENELLCVAIAPDNQTLISGDNDGNIQIGNLQTGNLATLPKIHEKLIHTIAISPDGKIFATGSADKTIQIWNINPLKRLYLTPKQEAEINVVSIALDNQTLISGDKQGTIKIWNLLTGELLNTLPNVHEKSVNCLALSQDGEMFATGSADKIIKIWNLQTGHLIQTLNQEGGTQEEGNTPINAIAFSPNSQILISGSKGKSVSKSSKFKFGHLLENPAIKVFRRSGGKDRTKASFGGSLRIWNIKTGTLLEYKKRVHASPINSLAISSDGQLLVTASKGGSIMMWQRAQS
ncbi:WD40 repeat domain-containing protein [Nostoc sphaeroides]|uniref:WD40 repeat domain-containing protein n=1 Tax=Nostoc sphaeroides CCNUC1 TaxID=2653204 RepID=A0A5P8WAX2_9NOSO|nr:WD40 repeat domain-containing protein [Nostoc sphaeroides]QFS49754.1 WD40 repeat domain-containing protein [Nostoc sphaeroides CCNUC1]